MYMYIYTEIYIYIYIYIRAQIHLNTFPTIWNGAHIENGSQWGPYHAHTCFGFFWEIAGSLWEHRQMQGACHVHVPLSVDACPRVFLFSFFEIAGGLGSNQCGGYPYANLGLVPPLTHCTHTALCHEAIRGRTLPRCWHMGDVAG